MSLSVSGMTISAGGVSSFLAAFALDAFLGLSVFFFADVASSEASPTVASIGGATFTASLTLGSSTGDVAQKGRRCGSCPFGVPVKDDDPVAKNDKDAAECFGNDFAKIEAAFVDDTDITIRGILERNEAAIGYIFIGITVNAEYTRIYVCWVATCSTNTLSAT